MDDGAYDTRASARGGRPMTDQRPNKEVYVQRDNPAIEAWFAARTASLEAAFFLPYLRPGMQVLDVGCGPGSITLGLAEVAAPGQVVGIDLQPTQIEQARASVAKRAVANVRFEVADAYRLPFPAHSFDAAFAHGVLMHLREPVRALVEIRRVLRPSGIVGVRDQDLGGDLFSPMTPLLEQWLALRLRVRQHHGRDSFVGRHHRRLLLEAGFARAEARASVEHSAGSLEETRTQATWFKSVLHGEARTALAEGWVTQATVDAMMAEIDAWAERPDAFSALILCATVGWARD
jgi:SAM-dependent methyltransferase